MKGLIKSIENNVVQYDVDTTNGQSGSPILVEYMEN
jgi:V8-like Glu-specific endopeptidase